MSFKSHINYLSRRLARTAALFYRVKPFVPEFVMRNMYQAHFLSLISYCNLIWSSTFPSHLDPITKLQKRVIRIISNSDFLAHTDPLFKQLKLLDLSKINKYNLGVYFFKNRFSLLQQLTIQHPYPTRNRHRPIPSQHNTTIYERSFTYQAPKVWNELLDHDPNVLNITSLNVFKGHMKKYLLAL